MGSWVCSGCGHRALKWTGRCPSCGETATFDQIDPSALGGRGGSRGMPIPGGGGAFPEPLPLADIVSRGEKEGWEEGWRYRAAESRPQLREFDVVRATKAACPAS
eukprot:COSAG01_NODE_403_length_17482_cov_77.249597_12_plen_105_part_00